MPYAGRGLGDSKDYFNFLLSRMRQNIERVFGIMVVRWGILWRTLQVEFTMIPALLSAIARLHNFCIDEKDSLEI